VENYFFVCCDDMADFKETIKYFTEQSRNDFSVVEENLHKIILEMKASENKK
jgi:hypothetical protein